MTLPSEGSAPPVKPAPDITTFDRRSSTGTVIQDEPGTDDTWRTRPLKPEELVPPAMMWMLTVLFAVVVIAAINVLLSVWPVPTPPPAPGVAAPTTDAAVAVKLLWGVFTVNITANDRLMLIAIVMGVIGAMVHAMTSFADFVGNRRLAKAWLPWYFLRPLIGSGLALFFYIGFRAGLLTTSTAEGGIINPFGIAAVGGLAGMFSKQATDKLNEVFTTMFKTSSSAGDDRRGAGLIPNAPTRPTPTPPPTEANKKP